MITGLRAPTTSEPFTADVIAARDKVTWFHVYSTEKYPDTEATTFNQGWGQSRFAPVHEDDGTPVHTYYAANSIETAIMESVLHDVALNPPGFFDLDRLKHFYLVELQIPYDLTIVSFHTPYLPKLSITRAELIDSPPDAYLTTQKWAQAAYKQCPFAQAIGYGSRRNDAARCIMLFGQRLPAVKFQVMGVDSIAHGALRQTTLNLMRRLDLSLI